MVDYPSYDPTLSYAKILVRAKKDPLGKPHIFRAVAGNYPPGSSVKPMILAGALQEAGHEYRILDFCATPREGLLEEIIKQFNPEAVCISLRNIDNVAYPHSTSYFPQYKKLCQHVRKLTDNPIIIGGAGFSLFPERLLQELEADFGIVGSGEKPLIALLQALQHLIKRLYQVADFISASGNEVGFQIPRGNPGRSFGDG